MKNIGFRYNLFPSYPLVLKIIAPITPGIHPQQVKRKTITTAPQPLSKTANGGKIIHNKARPHPITK